jgi:uncharacterized PurR-regulated membrane protein YhhQ (DUF165 family)
MEVMVMSWSIIYLAAVLIANYTAIWFIPLPVFGMVAVGTLIFGITFTARDYAHKLGRKYVYAMILVSILGSSALSVAGSVHWRIILASGLAIALSETADTEIYHRLLPKRWLVRVTGSNAISIPLDSTAFNLIAFLGVFQAPMLISIIFGEIVTKYTTGVIVALWRIRPSLTWLNIRKPSPTEI